ncbi:MAG: hypothetical protein Q8S24_00015 [Eubacteriales bacterium]|nr:hypothetical protein [Eubacteriales bacterium]
MINLKRGDLIEFDSRGYGKGLAEILVERVKDGKRTLICSIVQEHGKVLRSGHHTIALEVNKDKIKRSALDKSGLITVR